MDIEDIYCEAGGLSFWYSLFAQSDQACRLIILKMDRFGNNFFNDMQPTNPLDFELVDRFVAVFYFQVIDRSH